MTNPFRGLDPLQKSTYAALCIAVASIVLWWRLGIIALVLLVVASLVKLIRSRRWGNPLLSTCQKVALWTMAAYWMLYLISALLSENQAYAWLKVNVKLYFIILPILCLLADTSYLTRTRIRFLFSLLAGVLLLRIPICIVVAAVRLLQGVPFDTIGVGDWQIDPLGLHHNYLALYINIALAYLYTQMVRRDLPPRQRHIPLLLLTAAALIAYLYYSASRSGILVLVLLVCAVLFHLTCVRKKRKLAVTILVLAPALLLAVYCVRPATFNRFADMVANKEAGRYTDEREILWRCGFETAMHHPLFGHASGDILPPFHKACEEKGFYMATKQNYGAHNQYIETLLETGFIGLAILLSMLITPIVAAFRRDRRDLLTVLSLFVVVCQIAFESMLNRQMGSQFIALLCCLLILLPKKQVAQAAGNVRPPTLS